MEYDAINPIHYRVGHTHSVCGANIEVIDITRPYSFSVGNALKYILRAGMKEGNSESQDLKKAVWYLNDRIKTLEEEDNATLQ